MKIKFTSWIILFKILRTKWIKGKGHKSLFCQTQKITLVRLIKYVDNFIIIIKVHHCHVLWKATIIDTSRPCAKSTSLGQIHKPKFLWILWVPWCNNVGWTKIELIGYFPIPLLHQFHLYVKCGWIPWHLIPLKPMTLMLRFKSYDNACKKSCTSFEALPFIYAFFSISKS
jgi:hypothetical protein